MALRIFVADDHEVVRRGICALLTSHSGWEICGEAGDGREAVENHPFMPSIDSEGAKFISC